MLPTQGRAEAGVRSTAVIQTPETTTITSPAAVRCTSRRRTEPGAHTTYATAMPGTTRYAASIFVLKASPTRTAHQTRLRRRPVSTALSAAPHARTISRTRIASGLLSRATATSDGNPASAAALRRPATVPKRGATILYRAATASTPAIALGSRRLIGPKPKTFALMACAQRASGGLSTLTSPPGSYATKKKLWSEPSIDLTAAE